MDEEKRYFTTADIAKLYNVGIHQAQKIVREIKHRQNGKLSLGKGKVLPRELNEWERGTAG